MSNTSYMSFFSTASTSALQTSNGSLIYQVRMPINRLDGCLNLILKVKSVKDSTAKFSVSLLMTNLFSYKVENLFTEPKTVNVIQKQQPSPGRKNIGME